MMPTGSVWMRLLRAVYSLLLQLSRLILLPLEWIAKTLRIATLNRAALGWTAGILLVALSATAYWQFRRPYRWHPPYERFSYSWWLHPVEWNMDAALPTITGNINAVLVAPDGRLWIGGDNGLLAYSRDQGETWTLLAFDSQTGEFRDPSISAASSPVPASPQAQQSPPKGKTVSHGFALSLSAYAAEVSDVRKEDQAKKSPPSAQPQTQTQQTTSQQQQQQNQTQENINTPPPILTLSLTPGALNFGKVQVGSSKSLQTTLINETKQVTSFGPRYVVPSSGNFHIQSVSCFSRPLPPGDKCPLMVVFTPKKAGTHSETIMLAASGGKGVLNVFGIGLSPEVQAWTPPTQTPDLTDLLVQNANIIAISISASYSTNASYGTVWKPAKPLSTLPARPRVRTGDYGLLTGAFAVPVNTTNTEKDLSFLTASLQTSNWSYKFNELALDGAGRSGWLAGDNGVIFRTVDGGAKWFPASQSARTQPANPDPYRRFLAPWYWLGVVLCGVLITALLTPAKDSVSIADLLVADRPLQPDASPQPQPRSSQESGIANKGVSDKPLEPGEPDALGLGAIAAGLAFFLHNDNTKAPLVLGINGRWGSGKSSLMNLLRKDLEDSGSRPVWFNAWHNQKEEQLLAALLQAVKTQAVPPWSQGGGWIFHLRLAGIRLQRYWLRLAAASAVLFLMFRVEVFLRNCGFSFGGLLHALFVGPADKASHGLLDLLKTSPVITLATGLAGAFKALSNGLTAFGTNPASLLTTMSRGTKVKDLDAQTTFRQRFAAEFADVTQALGKRRRMLILIDDLDRCRPEKVREVLEAVNFLVSSGDCFIVLGMARDMVEHCVGLSFRAIVDTLSWEAMGLSSEDIGRFISEARAAASEGAVNGSATDPQPITAEIAAKRRAYARLYLDKLIQIEVSVPEPTLWQKRRLFEADDEQNKKSPKEIRIEAIMKWFGSSSPWITLVVQAALIVLLLVACGFLIGHYAKAPATGFLNALKTAPTPVPEVTPAPVPATAGSNIDALALSASGANDHKSASGIANNSRDFSRSPAPTPVSPEIHPGTAVARLDWLSLWPFYVLGLAAIGVISSALRQTRQTRITDTPTFINALNIWHPLVMTSGAKNTPRTARRFQNRVRYLAMRQRALSKATPQSQLESALRRLFKAQLPPPSPLIDLQGGAIPPEIEQEAEQVRNLVESGLSGQTKSWTVDSSGLRLNPSGPGESPKSLAYTMALAADRIYIPEPLLVALAAIEEYEPHWICDQNLFTQFVDSGVSAMPPNPAGIFFGDYAVFLEAAAKHREIWPDWTNMRYYRRAYLRLNSEPDRTQPKSLSAVAH